MLRSAANPTKGESEGAFEILETERLSSDIEMEEESATYFEF